MDALATAAERPLPAPRATTWSADTAGIAVLEDDGTFFYADKGGDPELDIASVCRAFYRTHGDDYDQIAIYVASSHPQFIVAPTALAASWMVRSRTQGLGLPLFDVGAAVGSPARLGAALTMNSLARYPDDPDASIYGPLDPLSTMDALAHEFAHQWLAYVWVDSAGTLSHALLGRDWQHWNFFFDSDSSVMGGNGWTTPAPDSFWSAGGYATYGVLDQYLMGLRTRAEVDSFFVVDDPTAFDPPGDYTPPSDPEPGVGCRGRATWWRLDDIERVNGPRVPDGSVAPREFRVAFALVVPPGTPPDPADLAKLGTIRGRFPGVFANDTQGRGTMDVTLLSRAGTVRIAHVPLTDTEDAVTPRTLGARVTLEGGSLPLRVDPASVRAHWRAGTTAAFTDLALAAVAPDSFAAALPPLGPGTYQYWLSAASDSAPIAAALPAAGAGAPFTFTVGPDGVPPVIRYAPVRAQGRERLPQTMLARVTDNVALDSVWCEASVDGGAVATLAAARAGADSFTVALGGGLARGDRVAYRFVARDASAARNVAYSNAAFDTMVVTHDWFDDFENPPSVYDHEPVSWSWRDAWHLEALPDSLGTGTAWHCGTAGQPYDPHLDAALLFPYVYDVVPGTTLAFDERHVLEEGGPDSAYDALRLELQVGAGPWQPVETSPGSTHVMAEDGMPFATGTACWSGDSHGWVHRTLDLSPWAPGPLRVRLVMVSDDFIGSDGTWLDHVRVSFPDDATSAVAPGPLAASAGRAWPNPTRGALQLPLALPRGARVEWTLHDVQGRRVAVLWSGALGAGRSTIAASAPASLPPGLYFSRVTADGRRLATQRVALAR